MQTQKESVLKAILLSAREEFIAKGFHVASLRAIASGANVTLSNIYRYFKDKDDLFCNLLLPLLEDIEKGKQLLVEMESSPDHADDSDHWFLFDEPVSYLDKNREMIKLLLFKAEGSSLSGYHNDIAKWFSHLMRKTLEGIYNRHQIRCAMPSDFFIQNLGSIWMQFLLDSLQNDLKPDEIRFHGKELMSFVFYGLCGCLGISDTD